MIPECGATVLHFPLALKSAGVRILDLHGDGLPRHRFARRRDRRCLVPEAGIVASAAGPVDGPRRGAGGLPPGLLGLSRHRRAACIAVERARSRSTDDCCGAWSARWRMSLPSHGSPRSTWLPSGPRPNRRPATPPIDPSWWRRTLGGRPRSARRKGDGGGRRRVAVPRAGAGASLPRHPGCPVPSAAGEGAARYAGRTALGCRSTGELRPIRPATDSGVHRSRRPSTAAVPRAGSQDSPAL